jgi:diguanylate cyclase (GGDEF)-like protein
MQQSLAEALTATSIPIAEKALGESIAAMAAGQAFVEFRGELEQPCKDGSTVWTEVTTSGMKNAAGEFIGILGVTRNITERKQMEDQVRQLAFYDALTKLPNRRLLNDRLSQTMAVSKRSACYGALMFLDLDNFKPLNDKYGHVVGDMLLLEVANRLKNCVRETDTVARFGGDEFVVLIGELTAERTDAQAQAKHIAEKIRSSLAQPYSLTFARESDTETTVEHHCTASIGVALFIHHEASQDDILKWADKAMYQAKEAGRNQIKFDDVRNDGGYLLEPVR